MSQPSSPDSSRTEAPDASFTPPPLTFWESLREKKLVRIALCLAVPILLVIGFVFVTRSFVSICDTIFHTPRFYLSDIRAPPLNATRDTPATVLCKFTIQNTAWITTVEYSSLFISLRDPSGQLASAEILGFHQLSSCKVQEEVSLQLGLDKLARAPWNILADTSTTVFRVSLQTRYMYLQPTSWEEDDPWSTPWNEVRVGADVEVDAEGRMTSADSILLA